MSLVQTMTLLINSDSVFVLQVGQCAAHLHALDLQLHVVLSRRFPILPFLPAVSILPVLNLLPVVQNNAAVLRPADTNKQTVF